MALKSRKYLTPIGVDVKNEAIFAIQYALAKGQARLHAAASRPIPPTGDPEARAAACVEALRDVLRSDRFVGRKVISTLPRGEVDIRLVRLPPETTPDGDEELFVEEIFRKARQMLLYDPEEAVLDYLPIGTEIQDGKRYFNLLLIASHQNHVNRQLALLRNANLQCLHLDIAPSAAARVFREEEITYSMIELEAHRTVISVAQGSSLMFSRTIQLGMDEVIDELASALEISRLQAHAVLRMYGVDPNGTEKCDLGSVAEEGTVSPTIIPGALFEVCYRAFDHIVREIKRSYDYLSHLNHSIFGRVAWIRGPVKKVVLFGPFIPRGLDEFFSERIGVPVSIGNPFGNGKVNDGRPPDQTSAYTVAAGLALRGVNP